MGYGHPEPRNTERYIGIWEVGLRGDGLGLRLLGSVRVPLGVSLRGGYIELLLGCK